MEEINKECFDVEIDVLEQDIADISLDLLKILLYDRTTRKNIRWATDNYELYGAEYFADKEITVELITGLNTKIIQPRIQKSREEQMRRTKDKAEVFTPSWICNEQNNLIDEAWFGRKDVFNYLRGQGWITNTEKIEFPKNKNWKKYVDLKRLEITCGEAPYLVSRYDTVTGKSIPIMERIGILDRKLRVVCENIHDEEEWMYWTLRSFQSIYGYEYQGDNILLARENLLLSFIDYMKYQFQHEPSLEQLEKIALIISWNIWQMNGITMTAPYSYGKPVYEQLTLFAFLEDEEVNNNEIPCKIRDWRANETLEFRSVMNGDK